MYVHNIDPVLINIGFLEIRYYGLVYVIGFLLAYFILRWYAKKDKIKLSFDEIDNLLMYLIIGLIIGARIFEAIFWQPNYYFSNPIRIFEIWKGGMSFHGGLVGIIIAGWIYIKRNKKVSLYELADILSIPAMLILAFGRIANFINAELPGKITNISWCVQFPYHDGCRHPSQIYESLHHFIAFFLMLPLFYKDFKKGFIFWIFIFLYGLGRFITDFWRDDPNILFGINMGQLLSLIMVIISIIFLIKDYSKKNVLLHRRFSL